MLFRNNYSIFLFLLVIIYIKTGGIDDAPVMYEDFPGITCGENYPESKDVCTQYGTKEMLCCYFSHDDDEYYDYISSYCTFLSKEIAMDKGIEKEKLFKNGLYRYWYCKNFYFKINYILFFI